MSGKTFHWRIQFLKLVPWPYFNRALTVPGYELVMNERLTNPLTSVKFSTMQN